MPDQVSARHMTPDAARWFEAHALLSERLRREDDFTRQDFVFDYALVVVEIVDEKIQGLDPLFQSFFNATPFGGGDNPRDQIKGKIFSVPACSP